MKTDKKNIKIVAISLPISLLEKTDEKAAAKFQNRSEYIRQLIFSDLNLASLTNHHHTKKAQAK